MLFYLEMTVLIFTGVSNIFHKSGDLKWQSTFTFWVLHLIHVRLTQNVELIFRDNRVIESGLVDDAPVLGLGVGTKGL